MQMVAGKHFSEERPKNSYRHPSFQSDKFQYYKAHLFSRHEHDSGMEGA